MMINFGKLKSQYPASLIFECGWLFPTLYGVEFPTPSRLAIRL